MRRWATPRFRVVAAAFTIAVAGCSSGDEPATTTLRDCTPQLSPGVVVESGVVDGLERRWQLAVPDAPIQGVIFDFHGTSGTIESQDAITGLSDAGLARGYVVVTPQGLEMPARWTVPGIPGPDDIAFVRHLADDVAVRGCAEVPLFATGKSSGAAMSTQLACETDLFTAIAPVGGISLIRRCPSGPPVSVITFHGTDDAWVPYEGPEGWEAVEATPDAFFVGDTRATIAAFAERNQCGAPDTSSIGDDTTVERWTCADGHRVEFFTIDGGGHTHPGQRALEAYEAAGATEAVGRTSITFDGTDTMLDFFDAVRADTEDS